MTRHLCAILICVMVMCVYSKKHCPFPPNKHCLTWPVEVSWAKECSLDIPVVVVNDV